MRTLLGWGILGQLVFVASQFVTLLALTRFASVEAVGMFGLASAIVIPVFFFFDLSMQVNVAASARSVYSFQDFRTVLLVSVSVGFGLVLLIGLTAFSGTTLAILLILGATKVAESLSCFCYGVFQRFDQMKWVAGSLVVRSLGGTLLFLLALMAGAPVEGAFLAQLAVWSVVALAVDHRRARRLWRLGRAQEGYDLSRMRDLATTSFPLAVNGLLSALQGNMPRYAIIGVLNVAALGQFTVVGYAMQAISTVTMAAMQSLTARFSAFIEDGRRDALMRTLRKLLGGLGGFAVVAVAVSALAGDRVVAAIFGPDYANLGGLLAICVLAASLRAVVLTLQMCLLAGRRYRQNMVIRIGSVLAMAVGCYAGGAFGGLSGVAWGMCAAFLLHVGALALAVRALVPPPRADAARQGPGP